MNETQGLCRWSNIDVEQCGYDICHSAHHQGGLQGIWLARCMSPPSLIPPVCPSQSCKLLLISTELSRNIVYLRQLSSKGKQEESAKRIRKTAAEACFLGTSIVYLQLLRPSPFTPPAVPELLQETAQRTRPVGRCCSLNGGLFPSSVGEEGI